MDDDNGGVLPERVGIVLVHGIGEQRRFEHLDGQGREIIQALRQQEGLAVLKAWTMHRFAAGMMRAQTETAAAAG